MVKKIFYLFLSILFIASCSQDPKDQSTSGSDELIEDINETDLDQEITGDDVPVEISQDAIEDIVQSFSSPVEMALLMKELELPFSMKYLCPTDNPDYYNTNFKKALGLGILGADLGYLNIYEKTNSIISYITDIKRLADGIRVGQFFDFQTLKRLAISNDDMDSLMYLSVNSFNQMDTYLRETNRSNLSTLIVTGVWVEGLYLATQIYREIEKTDDNESINRVAERIGEQKIILHDLLAIIKNYQKHPNFASLIEDLEGLKEVFDQVKITYEVGEPESIEQDGMLIIYQNEKSIVHITDEQLDELISRTEKIRNKLIDL